MDDFIDPNAEWWQNRFFDKVPDKYIEHLEPFLRRHCFASGEVIVREGDPSKHIFLLAVGRVAIEKGEDRIRLGTLEAGTYFGEMGVLQNTPRSTNVVAEGTVILWSISLQGLKDFQTATGVDLLATTLRDQNAVLGERLAETNNVAVDAMRQQMEEFRLRAAYGVLVTNVILLLFVYTTALGVLKSLAESGASAIATSALTIVMGLGSIFIILKSPFSLATFGITLNRWRWVLFDSLIWSLLFCVIITLVKEGMVRWGGEYEQQLRLFQPWVSPQGLGATIAAYSLYFIFLPIQELVARGLLQGSLHHMLSGPRAPLLAILVADAIFSISHQHLGLHYSLALFIPGLFWGWMYYRHRSLLGVTLSHILIGLWGTDILNLANLVGN